MKKYPLFFVLVVCLLALNGAGISTHASPDVLPRGFLDFASVNTVYGWAYDPDAGSAPVTIHIYIDGAPTVALTANKRRDDLVAAGVAPDPFHGFEWTPPPLGQGTHKIQAFAINVPQGVNPELPSAKFVTVTTSNIPPTGVLDRASANYVSGWAYDRDAATQPVAIHFYIDGVLAGATLADDRRDDLVSAGVASDPFHGFSWIPPTLGVGTHTINAWAINTPTGQNPQLRSSPKTAQVLSGEFVGLTYIENSVIKVGAHLGWGGAVAHLSHRDINLVDEHDTGRLVQASFYDSKEEYPDHASSTWGWNPVQGGDKYNRGSQVLEFSKDATSIYTKSIPLEWNPDNKGGGAANSVPSNIILETWVTLSAQFPQLLTVRQKVTSQDTASRRGNHEMPAAFFPSSFRQLVSYQGSSPWTNGSVSQPSFPEFPYIATLFPVPERWASLVNPQGFGVTLFVPHHPQEGFNAYWLDRVTNYLRPALTTTLAPGAPFEITYYLIVGNWQDARTLLYQLRDAGYAL